jgi:hypothetical protein
MKNKNKNRVTFTVVELEGRSLLSGMTAAPFVANSPAVQADLAKIKMDQQTLQTDMKNLAPTLLADQNAIQVAIKNSKTVQATEKTLAHDAATWQATLQADFWAVASAKNQKAAAAATVQLKADWNSATTALTADAAAIQTAISNDPKVQAATAQLKHDFQPIANDEATLQADNLQLAKDQQAPSTPTPPPVTTVTTPAPPPVTTPTPTKGPVG